MEQYNLKRFIDAQEDTYALALAEIQSGGKRSHWIWYIFPQLNGLGHSYNSKFYGLDGEGEAKAYLEHQLLGFRLREMCRTLLSHKSDRSIIQLMGSHIDVIKLRPSMEIFDKVSPDDIFKEVLDAFYSGSDEI